MLGEFGYEDDEATAPADGMRDLTTALMNERADTRPPHEKLAEVRRRERPSAELLNMVIGANPHGNAEDLYVAQSERLNCRTCGGSGHVGDATAPAGGVTDLIKSLEEVAQWMSGSWGGVKCVGPIPQPVLIQEHATVIRNNLPLLRAALTTAARAAEPRVELDERAAFEKFAADNGLDLRRLGALGPDHIAYASTATRESWRAWQRALSWRDRAVSKPIGHLHSNGDFCVESMPASTEWPIALYAAARAAEPARKPLTKDQIDFILRDAFLAANGSVYSTRIYDFVREIEREHGIATSPTPPTGTSKEGGEHGA